MVLVNNQLVLNFLPIEISGKSFKSYVSKFTSKEDLIKLREDNPHCIFHRTGDVVHCIPISEGKTVGEEQVLEIDDNLGIIRRLVSEKIQKEIVGTNRIITRFPNSFIDTSKNLLEGLSDYSDKLQGMRLYPEISIDVKIITYQNGNPKLGVVIGAYTLYDISENVATLIQKGLKVEGLYVVKKSFSRIGDKNIRRSRLIGKIKSITSGTVKLTDYREFDSVNTSECHLEASRTNCNLLLKSLFQNDSEKVKKAIDNTILQIIGGDGKYELIKSIAKEIEAISDTKLTGEVSFTTEKEFLPVSNGEISTRQVSKPTFVYSPAKDKVDTWHNRGLNNNGPFDLEVFPHKEPKIVVVVPDSYKGEVEKFLNVFQNGYNGKGYFQKGCVIKYHLNRIQKMDYINVNISSANIPMSYREACLKAHEKDTYDLAIVIIEERYHEQHGDSDPYLVSKSVFMSQGIPVQEIEIESIRQGEWSWPYTLDNFALACYVKMGGTPWTLSTYEPIYHELVIGMGNAIIKKERLGESNRFVGITNVFSADGSYLLNNISSEIGMENYKEELLKNLQSLFDYVSKRNAWQKGDNVRLIFYQQFKDFKDEDIEAIKEFVQQYPDYNIEFAFVRLSQGHPFQIYDTNQDGVAHKFDKDYSNRGLIKGKFVPERGFGTQLGPKSMLLTITGPNQLITPFQGIPKPLQIFIHRDSTFVDINYITTQIFQFTFLNWRSFNPTSIPVTILYSNLIAGFLGKLRGVTNWNPDAIRTKLKFSRWFL